MPRAVLFDLDGVLIESRELWFHLLDAAARAFGHPPVPRAAFDACFGQGIEADMEDFFPGSRIGDVEAYFDAHFLDHAAHLEVNPEAQPVLAALRERGVHTAVVTNTQSGLARDTVARCGLEPDLVVGANDVARSKPAPDMVIAACERLAVAPTEALMVGDSRFDREAARDADVCFVGYGIDGGVRIDRLRQVLDLL